MIFSWNACATITILVSNSVLFGLLLPHAVFCLRQVKAQRCSVVWCWVLAVFFFLSTQQSFWQGVTLLRARPNLGPYLFIFPLTYSYLLTHLSHTHIHIHLSHTPELSLFLLHTHQCFSHILRLQPAVGGMHTHTGIYCICVWHGWSLHVDTSLLC